MWGEVKAAFAISNFVISPSYPARYVDVAQLSTRPWKLALYGPAVELECLVPELDAPVAQALGCFSVTDWPSGFGVTRGSIRPYDEAEVIRRLPNEARPLHRPGELIELYEHEDRFWVIDDRWGMAEINVLRGQWRSWVLPNSKLDPVRLLDTAVLWPLAQLLSNKGIHLVPAVAVAKGQTGVLLLCPFPIEPELAALLGGIYHVIGQRWTAVREEEGRIALLHLPGKVERHLPPRLRSVDADTWVDVTARRPLQSQRHAFCEAVVVAEAGRRPRAHLRQVTAPDAANLLRRSWPISHLHPHRRHGQLPARLAQLCRCFQLQLSRDPRDLFALLESMRAGLTRKVA